MSTGPVQRPSSRPAAASTQPAETKPTDAAPAPPPDQPGSGTATASRAGTAAASTAYTQAKADPDAAPASTSQAAPRPQARRDGMKLGKTPPKPKAAAAEQKAGVMAADEPSKAASPTANLSPTELQAARDRFGTEPTYKTVDDLFHARHPELKGKSIQPGQKELAKEWLGMRAGVEEAGIQKLVAGGKTDPKGISRDVFDARHPDLKGKQLNAAHQKELGEIEKQVNTSLEPLKQLQESPAFKGLDAAGQTQALALMQANFADPEARARVQATVDSLGTVKSASAKAQILEGLATNPPLTAEKAASTQALLGSQKFAALSTGDQKLVAEGLKESKADPKYADNLKRLVEDPKFGAGTAAEQTAILSQVKNYPDHRSVGNVQRMLQKDWFDNQSFADKQRSLKTVAYLSQHDTGDRTTIDNTLNKMLDPASDFKLQWKTYTGSESNYSGEGDADTKTLYLSRNKLPADNGKVPETSGAQHMVLSTSTHEVNHILNGDKVADTFKYFDAEYRAWSTGFKARYGHEPTNQEAMEQRIRWQLDLNSFYGPHAAEAMKDPAEAQKMYDFLNKVTGLKVDASNWKDVAASDPSTWKSKPGDPAPPGAGNRDNH